MGSKILLLLSVLVVITKNHAAACSLNAIGVNFGSYDVFSPIALDGIGTIDVNCDTDTAFTLILSSGNGSYFQRYMQYGTNHLNWGSYHIAAKSAICISLSADFLIIVTKTVSYVFCKKRSLIKKLSIESSSFDNKPSIYKTKSIDSFLSVFSSYH